MRSTQVSSEYSWEGVLTLSRSKAVVIGLIGPEAIGCGGTSRDADGLAEAIHSQAEKRTKQDKSGHNAGQVGGLGLHAFKNLFPSSHRDSCGH